jgi:anti-sigma factor RsiW
MEHLSQEQIASYRACSLAAADLLSISDHLSECEFCRTRVAGPVEVAAGAAAIRATLSSEAGAFRHLTYDQIASLADGRMDPGEAHTVERHARECAACAADLRDIRRLKTQIEAEAGSTARPNWLTGLHWLTDLRQALHGWRAACAFAAAAACLALIVFGLRPRTEIPTARVEAPKRTAPGEPSTAPLPATVAIRDGGREFAISADGKVAGLDGLPDRFRTSVEKALSTQRVDLPLTIRDLGSKRSVLLGPAAAAAPVELLEPIGIVIETQRPVFRWKAVAGAEYQVSVYDSQFQQAAASDWIREPEWRTSPELRRGVRYFWQLTVRRAGSEFTVPEAPEPEARFQVLDTASESDLVRLRTTWQDSHLVMGVAYAQAGLLNEARRELQVVAGQNPGDVGLAALLASVNRLGVNPDRRQSK